MSEAKPKVSVVMITYNHEKFIEQAVNSVLMQETNFDYEIIVGEDCSTDRTREILIELQKEHADKIKLVLNPQNLGMLPNFVNVLSMARGEYIALLEGDDYWTSPHKLQRQVDYMEVHSECRICFHAAEAVYEGGRQGANMIIEPPSGHYVSIANWLKYRASNHKGYITTAAVLFRRPSECVPAWFLELRAMGDWPLFLWLHTKGGHLHYLQEDTPMSVHRRHPGGVSNARSQQALLEWWQDFLLIRDHMGDSWPYLRPIVASVCRRISHNYLLGGDRTQARKYFVESLRHLAPGIDRKSLVPTLQLAVRCYLPWLYSALARTKRKLVGLRIALASRL